MGKTVEVSKEVCEEIRRLHDRIAELERELAEERQEHKATLKENLILRQAMGDNATSYENGQRAAYERVITLLHNELDTDSPRYEQSVGIVNWITDLIRAEMGEK